ncbi:1,4-alpha-glucan branching protein GlgB [Lachnospiraceae bacterium 29-84]
MDMQGFYMGQIFDAYEFLGAHITSNGVVFRTFAPNAQKVSLVYGTKGIEIAMKQIYDGNFYEVNVPNLFAGMVYEYRIYKNDGSYTDHCDPYGFGMELRPAHKSVICDLSAYTYHDRKWMRERNTCDEAPLNIYELHLGSWKRKSDDNSSWYSYDELVIPLIQYLKENNYNYVEFLPLCEHPCDESWGYQNTGYFSPTSRYGTALQLMKLIDLLHQNGIGAILDYVPVHFAIDEYALAKYDGSSLYEYPHFDIGLSEWGSYNFMHSRGEVRSFLQSAANYWLKEYHFDGLRMDAISRIIYWQGDERRGENGNAVDFLKVMNKGLKQNNQGCILAAEDSTNYPNVTLSVDKGGLGFDYKWDMGWMHDTLEYFQMPPAMRQESYHKLTFSMMYFRNERYLLPLSHDEVVHGKATILQKMNGEYEKKFPQARAMYLYMIVHPGKKLNFMGNEIGQLREWDEKRQQDWEIVKYPTHDSFHRYIEELNRIYLACPSLSEWDYKEKGFRWLDCHQEEKCIYAIERTSKRQRTVAIFNFGEKPQKQYSVKIPTAQSVQILLNSDWEQYGGHTPKDIDIFEFVDGNIVCDLEPFSGMLFLIENIK